MKSKTPTKQRSLLRAFFDFILTGVFLMAGLGFILPKTEFGLHLQPFEKFILPFIAFATITALVRLTNPNPRTALAHDIGNLSVLIAVGLWGFIS